ncbi:hypothetical protein [Bordetella petrii]|uniref:hypothetical protein n=1 Tax=Bordetella petrii TaxID=94624 RepID=UPI001A956C7A|nr:hypothetical protein [Bordetella petrii]MBO1111717.1 hypothetical protein [Bordetella petrii]
MKPVLCLAFLVFGACVAPPRQAASGPAALAPAAAVSPAPVCRPDADLEMTQFAATFPAMAPAEKDFSLASGDPPDCRAPGGSGFTSFIARVHAGGDYRFRDYWLAGARLLPSYPDAGSPAFLPPGWHWIELDR